MKKKLSKVIVILTAAVLIAGSALSVAFAKSPHHSRTVKTINTQTAACWEGGICKENGICDANGVCKNGGSCMGTGCYQDGSCDVFGICENGTSCDGRNHLAGTDSSYGHGHHGSRSHRPGFHH